jgi:putative nucleotidyltransferase with HDIG domain
MSLRSSGDKRTFEKPSMSFGKRRAKISRAQLRPASLIDIRQVRQARIRTRLARLCVVGVAILATAGIVHGFGPPFSFRLGQRPNREVHVNVPEFHRKNAVKTAALRQKAADEVPPSMINDPAPLHELRAQLIDLADAVAAASTFGDLSKTQRDIWRIGPATFHELRAAIDTPERRDSLKRRITAAFEPLVRDGVLGPNTLPRAEESHPALSIKARAGAGNPHIVSRDRVLPSRIVQPGSLVSQDFLKAFSSATLGRLVFGLVGQKLSGTPTLRYEEQATARARQQARDAVSDVYDDYHKGDVLVEQDEEIREEQLVLLRMEHDKASEALSLGARVRRAASVAVLITALFALIGYYINRHEPTIASSLPRIAALCVLVVSTIGIMRMLALQPWDAELIPIALSGMVLAIAYNPHFALMVTFALSLLTSLALGAGLGHFVVIMGGTAAGVLTLNEVRTRTKPIIVGATAGLAYFVLTWSIGIFQNQPVPLVLADSIWRGGWGLMTGFVLGGSLPFIENAFGIVTGISLLELGDVNHPVLQELVRRAPGTYNHSVTVGTIAEAAAERIGADGLLARIGAYFHDIGKMMKPHYFVENQAGAANRHANLAPAMSTLIIVGHVKDGVDLGRQHHLPEPIIDLIEQHHGTTLVEYFYREASRRSSDDPDAPAVPESAFRYPGPKPQTREAGILMVADAVESASRTLSEPTPARIDGLVNELVQKRLDDGQFDECGLTLREIAQIRESLIKSLIGIYHGRVKYPEQRTA